MSAIQSGYWQYPGSERVSNVELRPTSETTAFIVFGHLVVRDSFRTGLFTKGGGAWLETMADVALSDGRVDRAEAALLVQAGERIDWTAYDLQALLKRRKKALYQAARQQLSQR